MDNPWLLIPIYHEAQSQRNFYAVNFDHEFYVEMMFSEYLNMKGGI